MTMCYVFVSMLIISVVFATFSGETQAVATASLEGAQSAVTLCLSLAGSLCLWTGVMEVIHQCGLAKKLSAFLRPTLGKLFPEGLQDSHTMDCISANFSANFLGLGNAATPLGIAASHALSKGAGGVASPSLCRLVVCNTASIQLIPTTVAALRSASGSQNPMEILPAVWLTSLTSVTVGLVACFILERLWDG